MKNIGYKELYLKLFRGISKAIAILQQTQQETEKLYMTHIKDAELTEIYPEDSTNKE